MMWLTTKISEDSEVSCLKHFLSSQGVRSVTTQLCLSSPPLHTLQAKEFTGNILSLLNFVGKKKKKFLILNINVPNYRLKDQAELVLSYTEALHILQGCGGCPVSNVLCRPAWRTRGRVCADASRRVTSCLWIVGLWPAQLCSLPALISMQHEQLMYSALSELRKDFFWWFQWFSTHKKPGKCFY